MKKEQDNSCTIDIKDIINYCHCPMYQKFSHEDSFKGKVVSVIEKFDTDMHNAIYKYHTLIQLGEEPTLKQLNQAFAVPWIGENKRVEDILYVEPSSWRDTHEQKRKRGLNSLHALHKFLNKNSYFPLVNNYEYNIPITKSLSLTGKIELVRDLGNNVFELMDFKVDDKLHNKVYVEKDIEITAACMAFEKIFNNRLSSVVFYGLDKNKPIYTSRTEEDYKMLKKIVINVYTCIRNNIYYPCIGDKCGLCLYKSICINRLTLENML